MTLSYRAYNDDGDEVERYTFPPGVSRVLIENIAAPVTHRTRTLATPAPTVPTVTPNRPPPDYRAAILAIMAKPGMSGQWATASAIVHRATSALPKYARRGSYEHLRQALDDLTIDSGSPVQLEPAPRGDGRTVRRYRRT